MGHLLFIGENTRSRHSKLQLGAIKVHAIRRTVIRVVEIWGRRHPPHYTIPGSVRPG
jgi:hypothetical protein